MREVFHKAVDFFAIVGLSGVHQNAVVDFLISGGEAVLFSTFTAPGHVLDVLPESVDHNPLLRDIHLFCLPAGVRISGVQQEPLQFQFVLTNVAGERLYGATVCFYEPLDLSKENNEKMKKAKLHNMQVYVTKSICLVSMCPCAASLQKYLATVYNMVVEKKKSSIPLEQYLSMLFEVPVIEHPLNTSITVNIDSTTVTFDPLPSPHKFPTLDFSVRYLFLSLSVENVLLAFCSILAEKKVIFISSHYSMLVYAAGAIASLMFPFYWHHVYIPILPNDLLDYLGAPTPVVMGINSNYINLDRIKNLLSEAVIVDLDKNTVTHDPTVPMLPRAEEIHLRQSLNEHIHPQLQEVDNLRATNNGDLFSPENIHQKHIRIAFILTFSSLLGNYKRHYFDGEFNKQEFLERQPESSQEFLHSFLETQAWMQFENDSNPLFDELTDLGVRGADTRTKVDFLLSRFNSPAYSFELPKPQTVMDAKKERTYPGTFCTLSKQLAESSYMKQTIDHLSKLISGGNNQIEFLYLRVNYYLASHEIIKSLQDLETILEINASFRLQDKLLDYLVHTLEDLENSPEWFKENKEYPKKVGPRIRSVIFTYEQSKRQTRQRANSAVSEEMEMEEWHGIEKSEKEILDPYHMLNITFPSNDKMTREEFVSFASSQFSFTRKLSHKLFDKMSQGNHIRVANVIKRVHGIKEITDSYRGNPWLDPTDIVLKKCNASNAAGERGTLILTTSKLVFLCKKVASAMDLDRLMSVKKFNFTVLIPPGVPCLRLYFKKKKSTQLDEVVFAIFSERKSWLRALNEISIAYHLTRDLYDQSFVLRALHRVLLTHVVEQATRFKDIKTLYVFYKAPTHYESIRKILEAKGPLNIGEAVPDPAEEQNWCELAETLLCAIIDLFFSCLQPDGQHIDFAMLEQSADFKKYRIASAALERVDFKTMNELETRAFFINIYNALVIHALLLVGFPSSKLEWRYLSRSACYDIGKFPYTLDFIKHGILCGNHYIPWVTVKTKIHYAEDDPRFLNLNLIKATDPRIHFVLSNHNKTSASLRLMKESGYNEYLDAATREYVEQFVTVSASKKQVVLSKIFKWYREHFGKPTEMMHWVLKYLNGSTRKELNHLLESKASFKILYKYDWSPSPLPFRQFL